MFFIVCLKNANRHTTHPMKNTFSTNKRTKQSYKSYWKDKK